MALAAAIEDRPSGQSKPAQDGRAGQDRGERMAEQQGSPYGASEGREVRRDIVDGGDEPPIQDVSHSNDDAAGEGHGQEEGHHT